MHITKAGIGKGKLKLIYPRTLHSGEKKIKKLGFIHLRPSVKNSNIYYLGIEN